MKPGKLFSELAPDYVKYRPKYPDELFIYLSSIVPSHEKAWDCATGNGQAAICLARYFNEIIATDISKEQISHAIHDPKIKYFAAPAEDSKIKSSSIDLITVGTAIHWFDKKKFFDEAKRILKPGGILAYWNYTYTIISKEIDELMKYYVNEILGEKYWEKKALDVFRGKYNYRVPFRQVKPPEIRMECKWKLKGFLNYLSTWSSFQSYFKKNKSYPTDLVYKKLKELWGNPGSKKNIMWVFLFKVYKNI